jgi:hypothetical protein
LIHLTKKISENHKKFDSVRAYPNSQKTHFITLVL